MRDTDSIRNVLSVEFTELSFRFKRKTITVKLEAMNATPWKTCDFHTHEIIFFSRDPHFINSIWLPFH